MVMYGNMSMLSDPIAFCNFFTRTRLFSENTSMKYSKIEKWKVGVSIFLWVCHLIPKTRNKTISYNMSFSRPHSHTATTHQPDYNKFKDISFHRKSIKWWNKLLLHPKKFTHPEQEAETNYETRSFSRKSARRFSFWSRDWSKSITTDLINLMRTFQNL